MTAWYNEPDPYAAAWLRNLIAAGLIAPGVVDERKIQDVEAWELLEFTQCHFFAGIGIWSGALRAAGWPDDKPIWTGSCPCQPFSNAGKRVGTYDARHLWPIWFEQFIEICRPPIVVGEQVASKDGLGWFDIVSADMERAGYAIGASDLCAAGFGQAHLRQRLYFVGSANSEHDGWRCDQSGREPDRGIATRWRGEDGGLADSLHSGWSERGTIARSGQVAGIGDAFGLADTLCSGQSGSREFRFSSDPTAGENWQERGIVHAGRQLSDGGLADCKSSGQPRKSIRTNRESQVRIEENGFIGGLVDAASRDTSAERQQHGRQHGRQHGLQPSNGCSGTGTVLHSRETRSLDDADWLLCRNPSGEPSWRPVESGTFPLAHGLTDRMGKLRAYGNALDFKTAQGFCEVVAEIAGVRPVTEYDL